MNTKEQIQKEILGEVKSIAKELSNIQSFYGLLAYQQKIQSLYENFVFLKQLNLSKYQQILEKEDFISKKIDSKTKDEDLRDITPNYKNENAEKKDIESSTSKPVNKENKVEKEAIKTEKLKPLTIEIADVKQITGKKAVSSASSISNPSLKPIAPDFSDSISFISQLFNGSKAAMDDEFKLLNKTQNIEEAKKWIEDMFVKYDWKNKGEFVERLSKIIVQRFES